MTGVVAAVATGMGAKVSLSAASSTGIGDTETIVTSPVTASVAPPGPYSIQWEYVSGDTSLTRFLSQGATMRWSASGMAPGEDRSAVWRAAAYLGGVLLDSAELGVGVSRLG